METQVTSTLDDRDNYLERASDVNYCSSRFPNVRSIEPIDVSVYDTWPTSIDQRTCTAGGDRTHHRGIMRWMRSVGLVRWCPINPDLKEISFGGVGSVCAMKREIFA
jgi:hypothetical protein